MESLQSSCSVHCLFHVAKREVAGLRSLSGPCARRIAFQSHGKACRKNMQDKYGQIDSENIDKTWQNIFKCIENIEKNKWSWWERGIIIDDLSLLLFLLFFSFFCFSFSMFFMSALWPRRGLCRVQHCWLAVSPLANAQGARRDAPCDKKRPVWTYLVLSFLSFLSFYLSLCLCLCLLFLSLSLFLRCFSFFSLCGTYPLSLFRCKCMPHTDTYTRTYTHIIYTYAQIDR